MSTNSEFAAKLKEQTPVVPAISNKDNDSSKHYSTDYLKAQITQLNELINALSSEIDRISQNAALSSMLEISNLVSLKDQLSEQAKNALAISQKTLTPKDINRLIDDD